MTIAVKNINKRFGDFTALNNVSLDFPTGELTALLGPSRPSVAALAAVLARTPTMEATRAETPPRRGTLQDYLSAQDIEQLGIDAAQIEDVYPLSPLQEGMLFLSLETPGTGLYVNQLSVPVEGLDSARLASAWQAMVR
eukprot:gene14949-19103_t